MWDSFLSLVSDNSQSPHLLPLVSSGSLTMNFADHQSHYDTIRPSPSQQVELENHEALTPYDGPFPDDFLDVGGFAADPFPDFYPQAPPSSFQHVTHSPV